MTRAEACRRKAKQWLNAAETATDTNTSDRMRHVSELWIALAQQIERTPSSVGHTRSELRRPIDLAKPKSVQVGDILRNRLRLGDDGSDEVTE